jgi:hypothetical protein
MTPLLRLRSQLRERLGESIPAAWTDLELDNWLNEGVRDISIRAECNEYMIELVLPKLVYLVQFPGTSGTLVYPNGSSTWISGPPPVIPIRTFRCTWIDNPNVDSWNDELGYLTGQPGTGPHRELPLRYASISSLDSVRGSGQQSDQGEPTYYSIWGQSGNMKLVLYPRPHSGGNLRVYFYGIPAPMKKATDTHGLPHGWDHLILDYAEYKARLRDGNQIYQEAKTSYEGHLDAFKTQFTRLDLHDHPIEESLYWAETDEWGYW